MNFDCSCFWSDTLFIDWLLFIISFNFRVRDKFGVINAMSVDPVYLQHKHAEKATDLRVIISRQIHVLSYFSEKIFLFSIGVLH
jgi:hypothetical protein